MWNEQELSQLYNAVFHRKSVKKYTQQSLTAETVNEVKLQLEKLLPLFPKCKIAFRVLDSGQVKGRVTTGAHYIAAYAEHGLESYTNVGFMLQQMDLWLSSKEIGSWWHGLIQPTPEFETVDGFPFAFMLTFGNADEAVHRRGSAEYSRKDISQITDAHELVDLLEPVRLAPSGRNAQTWYITGDKSKLYYYKAGGNAVINKLFPDVHYLDGGIGLLHLWLSAKAKGYAVEMTRDKNQASLAGKREYICSVKLTKE